jgi:hypothetical protein
MRWGSLVARRGGRGSRATGPPLALAAASLSGKTVTTPVKQKAAANKAAGHGKAKPPASPEVKAVEAERKPIAKEKADTRAKRVARWMRSNGVQLVKRVRVKDQDGDVIGVVSYRHTHTVDGAVVGMIGVALTGRGDALMLKRPQGPQ